MLDFAVMSKIQIFALRVRAYALATTPPPTHPLPRHAPLVLFDRKSPKFGDFGLFSEEVYQKSEKKSFVQNSFFGARKAGPVTRGGALRESALIGRPMAFGFGWLRLGLRLRLGLSNHFRLR